MFLNLNSNNNINELSTLERLLEKLEKRDNCLEALNQVQETLEVLAKDEPSERLVAFDEEHKIAFIESKIGAKPPMPKGILRVVPQVYLYKKKKHDTYEKVYPLAESAYREAYAKERGTIIKEDEEIRQRELTINNSKLERLKAEYDIAEKSVENDSLLSADMKQTAIIKTLIKYFQDKRADSLKEAVNLWYDEKRKDEEEQRAEEHRKEMKRIEEERLRAEEEAAEYARMQYEAAEEAAEYARQAAYNAEQCMEEFQRRDM
jgi:hypothetical protein